MFLKLLLMCLQSPFIVILLHVCVAAKSELWKVTTTYPKPWELSFAGSIGSVSIKTLHPTHRIICNVKEPEPEPWVVRSDNRTYVKTVWKNIPINNDRKCCMFMPPTGNDTVAVFNSQCIELSKKNYDGVENVNNTDDNTEIFIGVEVVDYSLGTTSIIVITVAITTICIFASLGAIIYLRKRGILTFCLCAGCQSKYDDTYDVQLPNEDAPRMKTQGTTVEEDDYGYLISSPVASRESCGYIDVESPAFADDDGYGILQSPDDRTAQSVIYENLPSVMCLRN